MTEKKNAINISITMILLSLITIALCWPLRKDGITEVLYVLASGIFGSSFATLWVFIYEYRKAKQELLRAIYDEVTTAFVDTPLCHLGHYGLYNPNVQQFMQGKHYMPPAYADDVARMSRQDQQLYILCRFVDEILDIGCDRIRSILNLVSSVDFWSNSFPWIPRYRNAILRNISSPLYEVFIMKAPAEEDGYLFRYFKGFKIGCDYTADQIYEIACKLDLAMHGDGSSAKYNWQGRNPNLVLHLYEKMWIFYEAFCPPPVSKKRRKEAIQAFLNDTPFPYVK